MKSLLFVLGFSLQLVDKEYCDGTRPVEYVSAKSRGSICQELTAECMEKILRNRHESLLKDTIVSACKFELCDDPKESAYRKIVEIGNKKQPPAFVKELSLAIAEDRVLKSISVDSLVEMLGYNNASLFRDLHVEKKMRPVYVSEAFVSKKFIERITSNFSLSEYSYEEFPIEFFVEGIKVPEFAAQISLDTLHHVNPDALCRINAVDLLCADGCVLSDKQRARLPPSFVAEIDRIAKEKDARAERLAREKAEKLLREQAETIAREKAEKVAREKADKIARENAERHKAEREQAEREKAERERAEKLEREAAAAAAVKAAEKAAKEQAAKLKANEETTSKSLETTFAGYGKAEMGKVNAEYYAEHFGDSLEALNTLTEEQIGWLWSIYESEEERKKYKVITKLPDFENRRKKSICWTRKEKNFVLSDEKLQESLIEFCNKNSSSLTYASMLPAVMLIGIVQLLQ